MMRYLRWILFFLAMVACSSSLAMVLVAITNPDGGQDIPARIDTVRLALDSLGLAEPDEQTLVITATAEGNLENTNLWNSWASLEEWPGWSPLHTGTRWVSANQWSAGNQFEETIQTGLPVGSVTLVETLQRVDPGRLALWCGGIESVRACQVWLFEEIGLQQTRTTFTQVYHGPLVTTRDPTLDAQWQDMTNRAVVGLLQWSQPPADDLSTE